MSDAVVLLSGGLDSYTAAAIARADGFRLHALTIRYGQRHAKELEAARAVAQWLGIDRHIELDVNLSTFGGSSLTTDTPVPKDRPIDPHEIPSTYVPARNTVFLSLAALPIAPEWRPGEPIREIPRRVFGERAVPMLAPEARADAIDPLAEQQRRQADRSVPDAFAAPIINVTPLMGCSTALRAAGMASGRVMSAVASAREHSHVRSIGNRSTADAMTCLAVLAFCVRFEMIISTVTDSCPGCQQS